MNKFNKSKQFEDRAKVIIRAGLEMIVSLVAFQMIFEPFYTFWPWVWCLSVFTFAAIRSVFYEFIDLWTLFFIITYFSQNLFVNSVDFIYFKNFQGFYHDEHFHKMFSYKLY